LAGACLILVARRPETVFRAEFSNDDGQVFYLAPFFADPIQVILREWGGYLVVVPRVISIALRTVPPILAPALANSLSLLVVAGIAALMASDRLELVIPSRPLRWALAIGLLLIPGSFETLGTITNLQWYLAIGLALMSLATSPTTRLIAVIDSVFVLLASLTGPFSILLAPLFWLRALERRDRFSNWLAALITMAAMVQVSIVLGAGGRHPDPFPLLDVLAYRVVDTLLLGSLWTLLLTRLGVPDLVAAVGTTILAAALIVVTLTSVLNRAGLKLLIATSAIFAAGLIVLQGGYHDLLESPYIEARYFLIPGAFVISVVIVGAMSGRGRPRIVAAFLGLIMTLAIVGDFRLPAHPSLDWATTSACIGSPTPCSIPVDPVVRWTIHWPGTGGQYEQPRR
jgi:hypothetical protein